MADKEYSRTIVPSAANTEYAPEIEVSARKLGDDGFYTIDWGVEIVVADAFGEYKRAVMTIENARDLVAALGAAIAAVEANIAVGVPAKKHRVAGAAKSAKPTAR